MIDFFPSPEQQQIIDTVGKFLNEKLPVDRHRKERIGGAIPASVWREIVDLGLLETCAIGNLPDAANIDGVLVFREIGRHLGPMRLLASVVGAGIAAARGDQSLSQSILSGDAKVSLAFPTKAVSSEKGFDITVMDPAGSSLVCGMLSDGWYLMEATSNISPKPLHSMDPTIDLAAWSIASPSSVIKDPSINEGALLLCTAMLVGIAEATRDMAVEYAKQRQQFGQAIGSFQAIKHICADMMLRSEAASTATFLAALKSSTREENILKDVLAAKIVSMRAALANAAACIQVHGGIGFTSECDAHLFQKRSNVLDQWMGGYRFHELQMAAI